jgi:hypothetical protein
MSREIKLDGGEISVLKSIGISGLQVPGKTIVERSNEMETAELLDTINGLIAQDFLQSDRSNLRSLEDLQRANFHINAAYARELRDAVHPSRREEPRTRRRRRV